MDVHLDAFKFFKILLCQNNTQFIRYSIHLTLNNKEEVTLFDNLTQKGILPKMVKDITSKLYLLQIKITNPINSD